VKYALFIGKFEIFHEGHQWLIDQKLKQGIPVAIGVRNVNEKSWNNFLTVNRYYKKYRNVRVFLLPVDIESINYGRDVGYEVNEWIPPPEIAEISATKIREEL